MIRENKGIAWAFIAALLGCQAAISVGIQSGYFTLCLIVVVWLIVSRPSDAIWMGYILLVLTSQLYPIGLDEFGSSTQGAFRPYILAIVILATATLIGIWLRSEQDPRFAERAPRTFPPGIIGFTTVFILALAVGAFRSLELPGLATIIRECSGFVTLLVFLILGLRCSTSPNGVRLRFTKLTTAALAYSLYFVVRFVFLWFSSDSDQVAAVYAYSQRDVAFFSGVVLVIMVGQLLTSEEEFSFYRVVPAGSVLLLSTLLSGSRSVFACELIVILLFVLIWRSSNRVRLGLVAFVAVLVLVLGPTMWQGRQSNSDGGIAQYVIGRFLSGSLEDTSLLARGSEMLAVIDSIREHPLIGRGPLAAYSFFDPIFGWKETTFLDSGLGYLLMKTGLLGLAMFSWFSVQWLRMERSLRRQFPSLTVAVTASFVFFLVFLPFGPSFFEFQHAWFIGLVLGQTVIVGPEVPPVRSGSYHFGIPQPGSALRTC